MRRVQATLPAALEVTGVLEAPAQLSTSGLLLRPRRYSVRRWGVPNDVSREEMADLQSECEQPKPGFDSGFLGR
jgi:hypothetical protein